MNFIVSLSFLVMQGRNKIKIILKSIFINPPLSSPALFILDIFKVTFVLNTSLFPASSLAFGRRRGFLF